MKEMFFQDKLHDADVKKFLIFPGEKLILATREHAAPLFLRLMYISLFMGFFGLLLPVATVVFFQESVLAVEFFLTILFITLGLYTREVIHWFFHLYIITNRKIVEVSYNPLSTEISNSILLDQLRCTEIDAEVHGALSEILDIGTVVITFDRPTHQEEFRLTNIRSPRKTANSLSLKLYSFAQTPKGLWTRRGGKNYTYLEENDAQYLSN